MFDRIKAMFASKPPRTFQHPIYGRFEAEHGEECWMTEVQQDGTPLSLSVLGSEALPDATRMEAVDRVFAELDSLRAAALDFIVHEQPDSARQEFSLTGLDFGCVSGLEPGDFELEFARTGDTDGIWRVVFTAGTPTHLGRDS